MTLRVLHVDTERGWRGGERQALWLALALEKRGHASLVAARPGEPLFQRVREAGLETIGCSPVSELDAVAAWRLRREVRRRRIDIVHAHTAHAVGLAALATLGQPVPLVAARRVDFPLRRNAVTRWKYARAAAIVAVSRAVANVLVQCGVPAGAIHIVPDGVDLQRVVQRASADDLAAFGIRAG
ncbi:MAG TPA: glycosyltransferase family 4 protein, partial [Casimicrobiaceae bacterium]